MEQSITEWETMGQSHAFGCYRIGTSSSVRDLKRLDLIIATQTWVELTVAMYAVLLRMLSAATNVVGTVLLVLPFVRCQFYSQTP